MTDTVGDGAAGSPKKRRLATLGAPAAPASAVDRIAAELSALDADASIARVGARDVGRPLKTTVSLCPTCLRHVPALVFERGARVILARSCPEHGPGEAVLENDARFYALSNKDRHGRRFAEDRVFRIPELSGASCCGPGESCGTDQDANRSCTVLVEVTNACNLECRVCYSESDGDRFLPFDAFRSHVRALVEKKGVLDSVQVTGGESTLHPRFWDIVDWLHAEPGVRKVFLPTNGLRLSSAEERSRLGRYADKVMVLLQFDALSREANRAMRRAEPAELRRRIVADLDRLGVPVQLTVTLAAGVNEGEIGDVLDVALAHRAVKLVAIQPATSSGRYELDLDPMRRATLSDAVHAVLGSARLRMRREDFVPIPCSHPNCGWLTVFLRRFGLVHNVVRHVDLERAMNDVAYKTMLSTDEIRDVVGTSDRSVLARVAAWVGGRLVRSTDMFSIAVKPFMDRHTYDQDRIANCCHHITTRRGELRSFCEYNALERRRDPWDALPLRDGAV